MTHPRYAAAPGAVGDEGGANNKAGGPLPTILGDALTRVEFPDLRDMAPRARAIALGYYEAGYTTGIAAGREQLEQEWTDQHAYAALIARQVAEHGPYADLAERRGHHLRAERQREILAERGLGVGA